MHYWFSTSAIEKQLLYVKICFSGFLPSVFLMLMQCSIYITKEFHTRLKKKKKFFHRNFRQVSTLQNNFWKVFNAFSSTKYLHFSGVPKCTLTSLPSEHMLAQLPAVVHWVSFGRSLEWEGFALSSPESNPYLCERHQSDMSLENHSQCP